MFLGLMAVLKSSKIKLKYKFKVRQRHTHSMVGCSNVDTLLSNLCIMTLYVSLPCKYLKGLSCTQQ